MCLLYSILFTYINFKRYFKQVYLRYSRSHKVHRVLKQKALKKTFIQAKHGLYGKNRVQATEFQINLALIR